MSLLNAEPPKPPSGIRKYVSIPLLILIVVLAVAIVGLLGFKFWNYSEERAVSGFLTALEQGNYREAYNLWQPSPSYTFEDFLAAWGEQADYGKIRNFQILGSRSKGPSTVVVTVRINNVEPPIDLLVDRKTKGIAYSIF